jgi:hypothetical protein
MVGINPLIKEQSVFPGVSRCRQTQTDGGGHPFRGHRQVLSRNAG